MVALSIFVKFSSSIAFFAKKIINYFLLYYFLKNPTIFMISKIYEYLVVTFFRIFGLIKCD